MCPTQTDDQQSPLNTTSNGNNAGRPNHSFRRFTSNHRCPVCGGADSDPRDANVRCYGFLSDDGNWAHCTREEYAPGLEREDSNTYAHRLTGSCRCGEPHSEAARLNRARTAEMKAAIAAEREAEARANAPETASEPPQDAVVTDYEIKTPTGELVAIHRRIQTGSEKTFRWLQPDGSMGLGGIKAVDLPLYNINNLPCEGPVFAAEGEKAASALIERGFAAVGIVTGAPGVPSDDVFRPLIGRRIIRWPDFDTPGKEQTRKAAEAIERLGGTSVEIPNPDRCNDKGDDAYDYFAKGGTPEELRALVDGLPRLNERGKLLCCVCSHVKAKRDSELPRDVEATHTVGSLPLCNDCVKDAQSRQLLAKYGPARLLDLTPSLTQYLRQLELVQRVLSTDALVTAASTEANPWNVLKLAELIHFDSDSREAIQIRVGLLPHFIEALANYRAHAEVETLLGQAKNVFSQGIGALREQLEEYQEEHGLVGDGGPTSAPTVSCDEFVADIVRSDGRFKYLTYRYATGETELVDHIRVDGKLYVPPLIEDGDDDVVLLPTGGEEYGSEELLFNEVLDYIRTTYYAPDEDDAAFLHIVAGYVMMTWLFDRLDVLGYLRFLGMYGTGKSHLLETAAYACYRAIISLGTLSPAVMFRTLDKYRGTLAIDEADFKKDDDEIFRMLNGGYKKGAKVPRCVGEENTVKWYDVFGPKLMAGRSAFKDEALESRCFTEEMKAIDALPTTFPIAFTERQKARALALHNKLLLWRFRKYRTTAFNEFARVVDPTTGDPIKVLRGQQIVLAILACIDSPSLRQRLVDNIKHTYTAIEESWHETREAKVVCAFYDIITNDGRPNYDQRVLVRDLAARLNASLASEKDRFSEQEIGSILGRRGANGRPGLRFRHSPESGTHRAGWIGGDVLEGLVQKYGLAGRVIRKRPVTV